MAEYDTAPQEADDRQDTLEESGVTERTDIEEDAPQEPPSDREDSISSSEGESSGGDSQPPLRDCLDVGCTWPCAHHFHWRKDLLSFFCWYPDLDHFGQHQHPEIPRNQSEMKVGTKDCQFCGIFFTIWQSDCGCGANAGNDHVMKSSVCRCKFAACFFRWNGQVSHVSMFWTCGRHSTLYELGLPTGKVVWSLYGLSNESFLTVPSSRVR